MESVAVWVFGVLNLADVITTIAGFARGVPEGNLLPAAVYAAYGPLAMFGLKAAVVLTAVVIVTRLGGRYRLLWLGLNVVSFLLFITVMNNLSQIFS